MFTEAMERKSRLRPGATICQRDLELGHRKPVQADYLIRWCREISLRTHKSPEAGWFASLRVATPRSLVVPIRKMRVALRLYKEGDWVALLSKCLSSA